MTDELGSRIPIRARATNDTLFLAPAEPEGWPPGARLAIEIPHPWLGRPDPLRDRRPERRPVPRGDRLGHALFARAAACSA